MENTIIENGDRMDVTDTQIEKLISDEVIYFCPECDHYHIFPEKTFADVDKSLLKGQYPKEGWGIFHNMDSKVDEIQKIDALNLLVDDDEALTLAKEYGFEFSNKNNPYHITKFPKLSKGNKELFIS